MKPMKNSQDDLLQSIASVQTALTLGMGLAVRADTEARSNAESDSNLIMNQHAMAGLLIAINLTVFLLAIYMILLETCPSKKTRSPASSSSSCQSSPSTITFPASFSSFL